MQSTTLIDIINPSLPIYNICVEISSLPRKRKLRFNEWIKITRSDLFHPDNIRIRYPQPLPIEDDPIVFGHVDIPETGSTEVWINFFLIFSLGYPVVNLWVLHRTCCTRGQILSAQYDKKRRNVQRYQIGGSKQLWQSRAIG